MGFNEYKMFSRAAQDAGIDDKDERKLIAIEPNMLLDEASPEFKKQIGPKTLQGFFEFLNDGQPDDGKEAIRLGNVLYQYRSDERAEKNFAAQSERQPRVLNKQDQKIINLGCHLIEDAFYSGKLDRLDSKSSAAAAFVFNNLAKIFQSQKNLEGFDKEKFDTFMEKVSQFENNKLFEKYINPEASDKKKSGQDNLDKAISQESSVLEGFIEQDWLKYRYELKDRLEEAVKILDKIDYLDTTRSKYFNKEIEDIIRLSWYVIENTNNYASQLLENTNQDVSKSKEPGPFDNQLKNSTACLFSLKSKVSQHADWGTSQLATELEKLRKKLEPVTQKTKKYNDLSSFGLDASKDLAPDAVKVFEEVFENKGQGLFNQYILQIKKVENLKETRRQAISQDKSFQASYNQMSQKRNNPSTIPYFFKSYIIASNLHSTIYDRGKSLKNLTVSASNKTEEHLFFGNRYDYDADGLYATSGPNYANVHYLPGDMPLAVWAVEYLESLEGKKDKKS